MIIQKYKIHHERVGDFSFGGPKSENLEGHSATADFYDNLSGLFCTSADGMLVMPQAFRARFLGSAHLSPHVEN